MVRSVTSEGYNRVKSILEGKYGKPSEVVNIHIQSIMNLPYIGNADPYKINRFYEKLQTQYTGKYEYNSVDIWGKYGPENARIWDISPSAYSNNFSYVYFNLTLNWVIVYVFFILILSILVLDIQYGLNKS